MIWDIKDIQKVINDMESTYPEYIEQPTEEENEILCNKIKEGDEDAQTEIIVRNRAMALDIVSKYYFGENIEDAYVSVLFSFIKSAKLWEKEKGKYSTYAYIWGRNAIERDVRAKDNPIVLPYYLQNKVYELQKILAQKQDNHDINTSSKDLAEMLDIPEYTLNRLIPLAMNVDSLDKVINQNADESSYHRKDTVYHFTEDSYNLEEEIETKVLVSQILEIGEKILSPIEYEIITKRYGLGENQYPLSLKETSKSLDKKMSPERVRQLEGRALKKLRHSRLLKKDILENNPELICSQRKYLKW